MIARYVQHQLSPMAEAGVCSHHRCAHHSQAQELARSRSPVLPEGKTISLRALGAVLAHEWGHLEGLLCTTAFCPEKVCARYKKLESTVREKSQLALKLE